MATIYGTNGSDTLSGTAGNDTIYGWTFGSTNDGGSDSLSGLGGNDQLFGGGGNDTLAGGPGADTLDGGSGGYDFTIHGDPEFDAASYASSSAGVNINLQTGTASGGDAQGDSLIGIEDVIGSAFGDTLVGGARTALLDGGGGADSLVAGHTEPYVSTSLVGGAGADTLRGDGAADYSASGSAVNVNLATGHGFGGDAEGDSLIGVANLIGSAFDDTLTGGPSYASLSGGAGNDVLVAGPQGIGRLDGGTGNDTADFSAVTHGINVIYYNVETVIGSDFADTLGGTSGDIEGRGGDDVLSGGSGADTLDGGAGNDWADYSGSVAVSVDLASHTGTAGPAAGDSLVSIENLIGSSKADTLIGDAADNMLSSGGGADSIDGGGGNDTVIVAGGGGYVNLATHTITNGQSPSGTLINIENAIGSTNNDTLIGDAGDNILRGGMGPDSLDGGAGIDTADYTGSFVGGVNVSLATGAASGGDAQGDFLINFENLTGSDWADTLTGDAGPNSLQGAGGDDILSGGGGADTLDGGAGFDTADYSSSSAAVTVGLANHSGTGGDAQGDSLVGIEAIIGSGFADSLVGDAHDNTFQGGAGADSFQGGVGTDTADYSASASGVSVSLATKLGAGGDAQGDSLLGIENLIGSGHDDTLVGDGGNNVLRGGAGADSLDGGGGKDTADYTGSSAVSIDLSAHTASGGDAAGDSLTGIENLVGSSSGDDLAGDVGANSLSGAGGNDTLAGAAGADTLDGGSGLDTADYSASATAVNVSLLNHSGLGGDAQGDSLIGIENLIGSHFGDTLAGDDGSNLVQGGNGLDRLVGDDGADTLDGGAARDTADYSGSFAGVKIWLANHTAEGGYAQGDSLIGIEDLAGSNWADTLAGDGGDNSLAGGAGADSMAGGLGADTLQGGAGADTLDGNGGTDMASYAGSSVAVKAVLATHAGYAGDAAGDSLVGIENLLGTAFNDTLIGDSGANALVGGSGADSLVGGSGDDSLVGGLGADSLAGTAGSDTLSGSGGNDLFVFGPGGGQDVINDFHHSAGPGQEQDKLDLSAFHFASASAALSHASSDGTNTYFNLDNDPATHEITLLGVAHVNANDVLV